MNDTNNERKEQTVRLMAVIGFIVMVCLLAWLAVQVVRFIPTTFSSLANIFEDNQRDYNERVDDEDNVVVVVDNDDTNNDEPNTSADDEVVNDNATSTDNGTVDEDTDADMGSESGTATGGGTTNPPPVQYKTVVTYKTPVSDPNGFTDLAATFSAIGYVSSTGKFVSTNDIDGNEHGALQFVVKNLGTKTSSTWNFEAELPDGSTIKSKTQSPLKPKETSTLTIVFGDIGDDGHHDVGAIVTEVNDNNKTNDGFKVTVNID